MSVPKESMQETNVAGYRLSPQQKRLWRVQQSDDSRDFRAECSVLIDGALDDAIFATAVQRVVERHEILRTTFRCLPGVTVPVQVTDEGQPLSIRQHDLTRTDGEKQVAAIEQAIAEQVSHRLDLAKGPLLEVSLMRLSPRQSRLFVTLPGLSADRAGLINLVREINREYAAGLRQECLSDEPLQYADLAEWLNGLLENEETGAGRTWWRSQKLAPHHETAVPFPKKPIEQGAFRPHRVTVSIDSDLCARIERVSDQQKTSVSVLLLTGWRLLLGRVTGQSEITVGIACDGRNYEQLEGAIGLFTRYLPFRREIEEDLPFHELLPRVGESVKEISEWQEYFDWEQMLAGNERDVEDAYYPLCFDFEEIPSILPAGDATFGIERLTACTDRFQIKLSCTHRQGALSVELHYDRRYYSEGDIQRLAAQFQTLLISITKRPTAPASDLEILGDSERRQLLVEWNQPGGAAAHACLPELFEAQVERAPDAVALASATTTLTYRELNARANQLAHCLRKAGIGEDSLVGLCVERSPEMVVGLLGILKAGGGYVPLDPKYPRQRLAYMIEDAGVAMLLTQQSLRERLPQSTVPTTCLDAGWETIGRESTENPLREPASESLAYVIYTSGSTGTPKGVMVSHRGLSQYLSWSTREYRVAEGRGAPLHSPLGFDLTITSVFPQLLAGRCVTVLPDDLAVDELGESLTRAGGFSLLKITPSHLALLNQQLPPDRISGLANALVIGGEALHSEIVRSWQAEAPNTRIINEYGPTETVVGCCIYEVPPQGKSAESSGVVAIGRPTPGTQLYMLNPRLKPVPIGVVGELYIGGAQLARGYLGRPDLTAVSFIPDSFSSDPGTRLYKTADLARYRADGNIEFLGRVDHQVKIRGFRIELGEIEAVLGEHPSVRDVVVLAREDTPADVRLVAYLAAAADTHIPELRALLNDRVPEYMIPAVFVTLESLPLTPNGKVDRDALPAPDDVLRPGDAGRVRPRNPYEEILANNWSQLLRVENLGVHDNFFDLGGHSLLATQVLTRLNATFHINLSYRDLFEAPTVAAFAERVEAKLRAGTGSELPPLGRVSRDQELPLSFAQERLWFLDQLEQGSAYHISWCAALSGPVNVTALEQVLNEIVRRHEALRTSFVTIDGRARQVIAPEQLIRLNQIDLTNVSETARIAESQRFHSLNVRRPFDIARGPLLRASMARMSDHEHLLVFTMHHIVSDAWSKGVLAREVSALYDAVIDGRPSRLDELNIQYADYAHWQRQWLAGENLQSEISYWKEQLRDVPARLELPTDRPRPAEQTFHGAIQPVNLSPDLSRRLAALGRSEGATQFMTLLTAFQALLHRLTGQLDIAVGTPIAGRTHRETEDLIGFFVNTLVMRADISRDPTFVELLAQVREVALEAYAHQDLPFEKLVNELGVERDLSRTPLFQAMFVLQNAPVEEFDLGELRLHPLEATHASAKFDITLNLTESAGGVVGAFEYNTDLFDAATIERMARNFETLLWGIVADPDRRLSEIGLLSEAERSRILREWNDTTTVYPQGGSFPALFEDQVARTPDLVAVIDVASHVTYRELNARANRLAHHLRSLGVGPERRVGLCMNRSSEIVVAVLAILKAGGTYVAIDPEYPPSRVAFMIHDSNVAVMLTETGVSERCLAGHQGTVVYVDADAKLIAKCDDTNPVVPVGPDCLSHIIYTSGSTGVPKGVAIERRAVATLLHWSREHYSDADLSGVLASTSLCFDLSVWELFVPLSWGGAVVLVENALGLPALAGAQRVTLINTVPSAITELLRLAAIPASARTVNLAGEPLSVRLADAVYAVPTVQRVCDLYGPSEDTTYSTYALRTPGGVATIGRPLANTQAYVLGRGGEPVPVAVPGELYLGGDGLARGYLNRPELTAERFLPDPFAQEPGRRRYRTGDRMRWLSEGTLEFLGRVDHQVKIRGFRIELGEIEAVLRQHPAVREVVLVAREDAQGQARLVAYMVPHAVPPSVAELRNHLKASLPGYMVPAAFVMLDALPLTPNGKVDRRALPPPEPARADVGSDYVAPQSSVEETLAGIWRDVLMLESVGVHDNFFHVGGDSIVAIRIVAQANQAGLRLTPKQVFQYQTIAELAAVAGTGTVVSAEQGVVTGAVPLTPIQEWFFDQAPIDPHHFNQAVLLEARGRLEPARLEQAVAALVVHHDALRHRFAMRDGVWHQESAAPDAVAPFSSVDLTALAPAARAAERARQIEALHTGFDLGRGPLFQVRHFVGGDEGDRLFLVAHHLVVDGVSWRILLEDLWSAYEQAGSGKAVTLPAKTTAFQQWAQKLRAYAQGPALAAEVAYWQRRLGRATPSLPVDWNERANTVASRAVVSAALTEDETQALLTEVPAVYGTQVNDVLLTALLQAFVAWTGSRALVIDLEGHGREELFDDVDLSRTVGWFTTIFPARLELPADGGLGAALKAVKEQLRAIPQRGIGFGLLRYLREAGADGSLGDALPSADVSFNYLGQFDQTLPEHAPFQFAEESSGSPHSSRAVRKHLLDVLGIVQEGRLQLTLQYSEHIHRADTIERLMSYIAAALRALIAHCRQPEAGGYTPSDFSLATIGQDSLDRLVGRGRQVDDIYPLSPLQQGLLFHSLYAPEAGLYVTQIVCRLRGSLDIESFQHAWQSVVDRHAILRTSFHLDVVEQPLQVVWRVAQLEWQVYDWRDGDEAQYKTRLGKYLEEERTRGFALDRAPLMRAALIRLADDCYDFVWHHHHALLDGWSLPQIFSEVLTLYAGARRGEEISLPRPRPYRDYIAWYLAQDQTASEAFWRKTLSGFSEPTVLGVGRPIDAAEKRGAYGERHTRLSAATTQGIQAMARAHHLTVNTVLQGAWALLLSRYSGAVDVLYGMTVSGRPASLAGVEAMVGLFINTLPARVQVNSDAPVVSWLENLQSKQVEFRSFEHSPLAEVQRWSDVPAASPLFESLFVFENYPVDEALREELPQDSSRKLRVEAVQTEERANYPLTVVVAPGERLSVRIAYDATRFGSETVERMLGHFQVLLEGMVANPIQRVGELSLLSDTERVQLLEVWNDSAVAYPSDTCLHSLFEQQVASVPDRTALTLDGHHVSYRALNAYANRLANHLRSLGVGPEVRVGLYLERSAELLVAILGILKAGGAYVPLDPAHPPERLAFMVADAGLEVVVTEDRLLERLPETNARMLSLDGAAVAIAQEREAPPAVDVGVDNIAYVIYTSGSTGKPKGTPVTHRNVTRLLAATDNWFAFTREDVWTLFHSYAFDFSVWEIWGALCYGGRLVVVPYAVSRAPDVFLALLARERVTVLNQTPSAFRQLVAAEGERPVDGAMAALRYVVFGGEALDVRQLAPWMDRHGSAQPQLINMYGITETTVHVTYYPVTERDLARATGDSPVGRPIPDLQVYVRDPQGNLLPVGAAGEIYVGGFGLARGYLGRPVLTAERFVPNPYGDGTRLYKTGDRARFLAEGHLGFLGRVDNQVKIRGFRIELGEIEAVVGQHPGIREAVVLAREDAPGQVRLVAYTVAHAESPDISELRRYLKASLPDYMMPSAFVMLDALPMTPNGKVDRRALPDPSPDRQASEETLVKPRNPHEEMIGGIWAEVLGIESVGIHDDFFELGGHSLLATQVVSRIRKSFQVELPLRALFEAPTVAGLAEKLGAAVKGSRELGSPPIVPRSREGKLPLSFAQQRLWLLDRMNPGDLNYNISAALRLRGPLDVTALNQTFGEIVRRQEVLRANFVDVDGTPAQVIRPAGSVVLPIVDLSALDHVALEDHLLGLARQEAAKSFDLARDPLIRLHLLRISDNDHVLLFSTHHIVSDGWSRGVIVGEFSSLYVRFASGTASSLEELKVQYTDFAAWQREWLQGEALDAQLSYWKKQLGADLPKLALPTDRQRPKVETFLGQTHTLILPADLSAKLRALSRSEGATLFMTLLAGFKTQLQRYTGQDDIVVGTDMANRNRQELEGLIGFFINLLVLRTDLSGNPSFRQLLGGVREKALEAYAHQDLPFDKLVEELQPERHLNDTPLFQVLFVFQNTPTSDLDLGGLTAQRIPLPEGTSKFDLALFVSEGDGRIGITWEFKSDLFDAATIARMAHHFEVLLESIVADPDAPIAELRMIEEKKRQGITRARARAVTLSEFGGI
jgi:amino acid adenylation domain-containing protein/non-ribosomal peptide synthase protein (TIGR01720 family)